MDAYQVAFGPCDSLNPSFGYRIRIERNGNKVLDTAKHPVTGAALTFKDCVEVTASYVPQG